MLQSQTLNRKAFDFFNSAAIKVANYYHTLDSSILDQALIDLDNSIQLDPNYFQPLNYKGIVYDMKGLSTEAIAEFDTIHAKNLAETLRLEVEYNRAIANYHLYSEPNIEAAIRELSRLTEASINNPKLEALAKAALAQSYGMMVLHSQKKDEASVNKYFGLADATAEKAISFINRHKKALGKQFVEHSIWIAYNAKGISLMFRDDLKRDSIVNDQEQSYSKNLNDTLALFNKALEYSPNNWALKCNLGSAYMRLGHLSVKLGHMDKAKEQFSKAEAALIDVLDRLRPNYDFAFYELGRINRFQKNKIKALDYFSKAKIAGGLNRNISVETIDKNIVKAEALDTSFNIV